VAVDELEILTTGDGSHTVFNKGLDETYHSRHGALQESEHVFIEAGLNFFAAAHPNDDIEIFEVGFGTGLNALLTFQFALRHSRMIHYTSIEAFPLDEPLWRRLNYASGDQSTFDQLHKVSWGSIQKINDNFSIEKIHDTLENVVLPKLKYDVIYFDAFAPSKQPEMWSLKMLEKIFDSMKDGGVFVTYCAKGQVKRDLKSLRLHVETLSGPPGKKEMVRAIKRHA
jgi:tRNA U34 5-methylaminomethyl-2-thiouridine-forming methyltransferase MnmC